MRSSSRNLVEQGRVIVDRRAPMCVARRGGDGLWLLPGATQVTQGQQSTCTCTCCPLPKVHGCRQLKAATRYMHTHVHAHAPMGCACERSCLHYATPTAKPRYHIVTHTYTPHTPGQHHTHTLCSMPTLHAHTLQNHTCAHLLNTKYSRTYQ